MSERRWAERELNRAMDLIQEASLPPEVRNQLNTVVRESRLDGDALMDVVRELIAHCEDALRAGKTGEDLARSFGDEQIVAGLISREKRRADPDTRDRFVVTSNRGDPPWSKLFRNLRYAARRATKAPGFTLTAVFSLAIGIGANTAIFTLVNRILLDVPPYHEPDRLVEIYSESPEFPFGVLSYPELMEFREATGDAFVQVAGSSLSGLQVEMDGEVEIVPAELVTGNHFQTIGLQAEVGRTILDSDERGESADPVAMLSHAYWQDAYAGDPGVVGRSISISGRQFTIIGVTPRAYTGSFGPIVPQIFAPLLLRPVIEAGTGDLLTEWGNHFVFARARLKDEATLEQGEVLAANAAAHMVELDRWREDVAFHLVRTSEVILYPPLDRFIRMAAVLLMVVVGLVLTIACANLASFLLARAMDRRKEIAVRLALGATRRDLIGQLASETVLLAVMGGAVGMVLGSAALRALVTADLPLPIPLTLDVSLNGPVFAFGVFVSTVAGLLFGVFPAYEASRTDVATTIKNETAGVGRSGGVSLRSMLVAGQVGVSFVLLIAAGLFLRSLQSTLAVDPGFGDEPAGVAFMALPNNQYTGPEARVFLRELLDDFRATPSVTAAGAATNLHLNTLSSSSRAVQIDGVEPPPGREDFDINWAAMTPGFLDAISLPLLRGRDFTRADGPDGEAVAIVNQAFVDRFWPGDDAVGRIMRLSDEEVTVVGVVATAKIRTLGEAPTPFVYQPFEQQFGQNFHVVAKTRGDPRQTAIGLINRARAREPLILGWQPRSLERHIGVVLLPTRLGAAVIGVFALMALVLAAVGLYGIVSYAVAQRAREVGIRMSLGADAPRVVRMLMKTGLKPVALGVFGGFVLAALGAQYLSALLFGVRPFDPIAFGTVSVVFMAVAILAAYAPARRVSRISPVQALRVE